MVMVLFFGWLFDVYGRCLFFIAGIVFMLVGSVIGGVVTSMGELIVVRGVQGLGGGALFVFVFMSFGDLVLLLDCGCW